MYKIKEITANGQPKIDEIRSASVSALRLNVNWFCTSIGSYQPPLRAYHSLCFPLTTFKSLWNSYCYWLAINPKNLPAFINVASYTLKRSRLNVVPFWQNNIIRKDTLHIKATSSILKVRCFRLIQLSHHSCLKGDIYAISRSRTQSNCCMSLYIHLKPTWYMDRTADACCL